MAARFVERTSGRPEGRLDAALIDALLRRALPTNVRELDALLWSAMSDCHSDTLGLTPALASPANAPDVEPSPRQAVPEPTAEEIRAMVKSEKGNVRRAAAALGLPSRYALYRLMKKHGIDAKGEDPD